MLAPRAGQEHAVEWCDLGRRRKVYCSEYEAKKLVIELRAYNYDAKVIPPGEDGWQPQSSGLSYQY